MTTRYKLTDLPLLQHRNIFVDANILIYYYWGRDALYWKQNYLRAFNKLLDQESNLFIDFMIISEIINRLLRFEHQNLQPFSDYKDFRNSRDGKKAASDIFDVIKNIILPQVNIVGKIFDKQEIEKLLIVDDLDFVDKSIVEICKENSLILFTNDKDFKYADIDILTGNPNILNS
jgi:predicted nucleic acid-binding protein